MGVLEELVREAVSEAVGATERPRQGWLDTEAASEYLSLTKDAVSTLAKRKRIPCCKAPNGRLLFHPDELDDWVRGS